MKFLKKNLAFAHGLEKNEKKVIPYFKMKTQRKNS